VAWPGEAIEDGDRFFYTIHVASFPTVQETRKEVLSLSKDGVVVFWKKSEAPGEASPYRIYFGQYPTEKEAIASWKRLQEAGMVRYFGIHLLREPQIPSTFGKLPARPPDRSPPVRLPHLQWKGRRFVDNGDGTVTDRLNQLMWTQSGWRPEFVSASNWWDAVERIKKLRLNGHDDWRLPTIGEWVSLVDKSRQAPALVEPNPFQNIITHLPYWSQTEYTYGIDYTCKNVCPFEAYTVLMYSGNVLHQNKQELAFIMPVRSLKPEEIEKIAAMAVDDERPPATKPTR
jgi:hypothetical protein